METIIIFGIIILLSFSLTYFVRKWAIHKSILDVPNERSSHSIPTPRGGGIAVAVSWFVGLLYFQFTHKIDSQLFLALLSGLPLAIIGILDDIMSLKPGLRFIVQLGSACLALVFLSGLHNLDFGLFSIENQWLLVPLALVAIVWAVNLFNFLDGTDGYISMEVIFICTAYFIFFQDSITLILAAAVFGFLIWNWPKAKIFMGDVGSTLLGFNVAIFAIYYQNELQVSILVSLILTSVFWFDATITLLRRIKNKEKLNVAHRKHAYQRIVQAGFSHQKTLLWSLGINFVGFGLAWMAFKFENQNWLFLLIDLIMLFVVLRYIDKKKAFDCHKCIPSTNPVL
jgi:Fuc2NAc and GlcNAc transferase